MTRLFESIWVRVLLIVLILFVASVIFGPLGWQLRVVRAAGWLLYVLIWLGVSAAGALALASLVSFLAYKRELFWFIFKAGLCGIALGSALFTPLFVPQVWAFLLGLFGYRLYY